MAKHYPLKKNSPIIRYLTTNNLTQSDLARLLNVNIHTMRKWVNNPLLLNGEKAILLCGVLGIDLLEFWYCVLRGKSKASREDKRHIQFICNRAEDKHK